jgi:GTP-binding protein
VGIERDGHRFSLIDTAGIRRRAKIDDPIEKISALTAIGSLERCEVAVLVLDASQDVSEQDAKIAGHIQSQKRAVVVALNKWDRLGGDGQRGKELMLDVQHRLSFVDHAAIVRTSAASGDGIPLLFQEIEKAHDQFTREIQTADLNRVVELSTRQQAPPMAGRSATRIYYGTQIKTRPPTFRLFTNHIERVEGTYTRFLVNQLRYHFGMQGTPIEILWSGKGPTDQGSRPKQRVQERPPRAKRKSPAGAHSQSPAGKRRKATG